MKIQLNNRQNVYFCSDSHYSHSQILKYQPNRKFSSLEEHDKALVDNINNTVGENDILFCLGDWSFGSYKTGENVSNIEKFRNLIKCKHVHILFGNHDLELIKDKTHLFSSSAHYREIIVIEQNKEQGVKPIKQKIVLSHYSHRVWNNMRNGAWMLFGHSHGSLTEVSGKTMDVGFDTNKEFRPYSYQEIKDIMEDKEVCKLDHH